MIIKKMEPLSKYTTFKMGGVAREIYFPESVCELTDLIRKEPSVLEHVIGGGSNLLINDKREFAKVLCLRSFSSAFENRGNGQFYIGASLRLQKVIRALNEAGYGGIEYLFSVPALLGGAIYMNAGRGRKHNLCISDYIESVDVIVDGVIRKYGKEECGFSYRTSAFQFMTGCIIIGASFKFPSVSAEESAERIKERINHCKKVQDLSAPNFGTVFCKSNKYIMFFVQKMRFGYKNGCMFSAKTRNWMLHNDKGSFDQAIVLLERVKKIHRIFGKECKTEVVIWK